MESQVSMPSVHTVRSAKVIFTIGYEGDTPEGVVRRLTSAGVTVLVDVREVPRSRKPGFSRNLLSAYLASHGVEYYHVSLLGSPKSAREEYLKSGDFNSFAAKYIAHLDCQDEAMRLLTGLAEAKSTAIMCLERDSTRCHRGMIASRMSSLGFEVRHL